MLQLRLAGTCAHMVAILVTEGFRVEQLPHRGPPPLEGGRTTQQVVLPHATESSVELVQALPIAYVAQPTSQGSGVALAEALQVLQVPLASRPVEVRQDWQLAAGEDVLHDEALPCAHLPGLRTNGVNEHEAIFSEQLVTLVEVCIVVAPSDVFEETNRVDAVV